MNPTKPIFSNHWSPEQATAVYEFVDQLADHIWRHYEHQIMEQLGPPTEPYDHPEQTDPRQIDLFDDSIPF